MNVNLAEMLGGNLSRVRNVIRFSNSTRIKDESVAEHSFFAAYYSLMLGRALRAFEGVEVDFGLLLSRALVHDLDEAITGDFIRHFKYSDNTLHDCLDDASAVLMSHAFDTTFYGAVKANQDILSNELLELWKTSKAPCTVEGDLMAFADFLSVLSYVMNEIDCGNRKLVTQLDDMYEYLNSFHERMIFRHYEEPKMWLAQAASILNKYIGRDGK